MGTDRFGYGFGGTGKKSNNKQFDDYGTSFGLNDVIGCALDLDNRLVSFYKNGEDLGKAFDILPAFVSKGLFPAVALKVGLHVVNFSKIKAIYYYNQITLKCYIQNAEMAFNFGEKPFKFGPPSNFVPICQADADSTIANAKDTITATPAPIKLKANAPQAIIIEVCSISPH